MRNRIATRKPYDPFTELWKHEFNDQHRATKWLNRYIKFIKCCQLKNRVHVPYDNETQTHHIVPQKWGGPNWANNKVVLTIREHIVAHHLLARTHDPQMSQAFHMIITTNKDQFKYAVTVRLIAESIRLKNASASWNSWMRSVVNLNTGRVYQGVNQADRDTSKTGSCGYLSQAIKRGVKCNGYFWEYVDNVPDLTPQTIQRVLANKIAQIEQRTQIARANRIAKSKSAVINLNTQQVFDSVASASQSIGQNQLAVSSAIRKKFKAGGYWWCYVKDLPDISSQSIGDKLQQLELETKDNPRFTQPKRILDETTGIVYSSLVKAARAIGCCPANISNAIRYNRLAKGHKFKFI